jgi:hypothetical protein
VCYIPKHTREQKEIKAKVHKAKARDIKKEAINQTVQNEKGRWGWKGTYL